MAMNMSDTYAAVYDAYPDVVIIIDLKGVIVRINDKAEQMFGFSKGELIGKSAAKLIPQRFQESHLLLFEDYMTNKAVKGEMKSGYLLTATRKDGHEFYIDISASLITIDHQDVVVAFVKEVTDRKNFELRFQKMVGEVQDYAIVFLDIYGNITNWNKGVQRIKGYTEKEIVGQNFRIFYSEQDQKDEKPERFLDQAIIHGWAEEEGWRVRKDGSLFWASDTITTIRDDEGHFIGFSRVTKDLTERKKADELLQKQSKELEATNKELEYFAFAASHDLQEPLNTVAGMVQLLKDENAIRLDEETESYYSYIQDAITRMRQLIKGLLDYSRLGRAGEFVKTNINDLVKGVLEDLSKSISSKKAMISIGKMPEIMANGIELRLVFQNIISNALKFSATDRTPIIEINAKDIGTHWEFSIKDNGIGIPDKYKEKIFIIFQSISDYANKGTGIGLAHCKKIVEIHGGSIWVESVPGESSTFYFTIDKNAEHLKPRIWEVTESSEEKDKAQRPELISQS